MASESLLNDPANESRKLPHLCTDINCSSDCGASRSMYASRIHFYRSPLSTARRRPVFERWSAAFQYVPESNPFNKALRLKFSATGTKLIYPNLRETV